MGDVILKRYAPEASVKARRKRHSIKSETVETIIYELLSLSAQTGKKSRESQMKKKLQQIRWRDLKKKINIVCYC